MSEKTNLSILKGYFMKVKNSLRQARSKELLTFLFFLCLSFLFWILQSMNETSEANYRIPLQYRNIPNDIVFTNIPPQELSIRIQDKGIILLNYSFGSTFQPIDIDVKQYVTGASGLMLIQEEQLYNLLKKQLNVSSTVLSLRPDTIRIHYAHQSEKTLPVRFQGALFTGSQFRLGSNIKITPDSVKAFAPKIKLDSLGHISTHFLKITKVIDTLRQEIRLEAPAGVKLVPNKVYVQIPIDEYTEKTLTLPLVPKGAPDSLTLRIFPANVQLSCFVRLRDFKHITPDKFEVGVDYKMINKQSNKIPVEIYQAPENVNHIKCLPDSVEYIIEDKE